MHDASVLPIIGGACCNRAMLTGAKLGRALAEAMKRKGVTQRKVADAFGIQQPSVSEWTRFGRIGKQHLPRLVAYFAPVVGPEHWGLPARWGEQGALTEPQAAWLALYETLADDSLRAQAAAYAKGLLASRPPATELPADVERVAQHFAGITDPEHRRTAYLLMQQLALMPPGERLPPAPAPPTPAPPAESKARPSKPRGSNKATHDV